MHPSFVLIASIVGYAAAQRPDNTSICSYYTSALLGDNNATNQYKLLTSLVNTVVAGNYSVPKNDIAVPGILARGNFNGTDVNLLPYFNGGLSSSNRGGSSGVAVNFLDDGGAAPLKMNKPANGTSSSQFKLLTHLYQYFGTLIGCSEQGKPDFPAYDGESSQATVHKYMNLDTAQIGYFIHQVGLAAASFGVSEADVNLIATALSETFALSCGPPTAVIKSQGPQLQSICQADNCTESSNATCDAYGHSQEPDVANTTLAMGEGSKSTGNKTTNMAGPSSTVSNPKSTGSKKPNAGNTMQASLSFLSAAVLYAVTATLCGHEDLERLIG